MAHHCGNFPIEREQSELAHFAEHETTDAKPSANEFARFAEVRTKGHEHRCRKDNAANKEVNGS